MKIARIVVLGIAVAAAGGAAFLAGRPEAPPSAPAPVVAIDTMDVLVAVKDINVGQTIAAADMGWVAWPTASANPLYMRRADRPNAIEQLAGSMTRAPIASGEPVRESRLIKANGSGYMAAILPAGMLAASTEISPETGAGGFILPNDRVDVILSRRDKEAETHTGIETIVGETLLSDVRVLAIDQNVVEKDGQRVVVGKTATLELTSGQAQTLATGRLRGTMSLALRSLADADPSKHARAMPVDDSINRINIVRFGYTTTVMIRESEYPPPASSSGSNVPPGWGAKAD
jgi:pilus assembly protein CpaB